MSVYLLLIVGLLLLDVVVLWAVRRAGRRVRRGGFVDPIDWTKPW